VYGGRNLSKHEEIQKLSMLLEALDVNEIQRITGFIENLVKKKFLKQN
jgi:hypothetical protein